jgi:intracellular sulfur oxidation DsrE/DsrF family protein
MQRRLAKMQRVRTCVWNTLVCLAIAAVSVPVFAAATPSLNGNAFPFYNSARPLKAVFEVPNDPKKWPTVALVLTHNLVSVMGHGVPIDVVLVAPGPTIHFFMKKYNPKGYLPLKRLHELGVKMVACHAALIAFHVSTKALFPFVGIARNSGVVYILKKETQGFAYYTWP